MLTEVRIWIWLAFAITVGWLLFLLAPVLTPFLAAALLAYLGDPVVDRLQNWKLSRTMAVVSVFIVLVLLFLILGAFLVPLLEAQVSALLRRLPDYLDLLKAELLPWMQARLGVDPAQFDFEVLKGELSRHVTTVGGFVAGVLGSITQSSMMVLGWLINLMLIPVVTFYLLRDWDDLIERIHVMLPRPLEPTITSLAKESDEVLGAFMKGQLIVMLALGTIYSTGLFLLGLDFSLLIGMVAGIVSFVPYLGVIVGLGAAMVAALFQFQDDLLRLFGVMAVFGVGQVLEAVVLTPTLVGDRIGLHPVAVIFAVLAGGQLFGFFGVLLALPVAAVIMVLLRRSYQSYLQSTLYND